MSKHETIDPVDLRIGDAIRARRRMLHLSQTALGDALGVTFQQVQKYERGVNRVSGSMMHRTAIALSCKPGDFFPEAVSLDAVPPVNPADALLATVGGPELARIYPRLSPPLRKALLNIANALLDDDPKQADAQTNPA